MPVWLNVAEKPSVAKQINIMLSNGRSENMRSLSKFNPVFKFNYRGTTMIVTSVAGHIMEEDFIGAAKSWNGFPMKDLFKAPIAKSVKGSLEDVKRNIESLMQKADTLVLWLDCDREGENIGFEVIQIAQGVKQRFSVKRAHFSALTQRDLQYAVDHLREPDKRLSEAVEARQEMDLRIGAAFTRFQTLRIRDAIPDVSGVISFGPCQFPALGFVVRREWERLGFTPENFFSFRLHHESSQFQCLRGHLFDQVAATLLFEDMLERAAAGVVAHYQPSSGRESGVSGLGAEVAGGGETTTSTPRLISSHHAEVVSVQQRQNRRRPPFPLATVTMQKLAATHLRITSEQCMKLAESLYHDGFLSYPRTETDRFTFTRQELLQFVEVQSGNAEVGPFAQRMLQDPETRFRTPLNGGHDDKAHPPIHPTKLYTGNAGDDKYKLYMLIVRHYLACLSPDAIDAQTTVTVAYGGEYFSTSGSTVVDKGWTEVFPFGAHRSSNVIPNYQPHEQFIPTAVRMEKSVTAPPPRLTETALIAVMDENGIGTDATIAQHIKTLIDRQYVRRVGQSMEPTPLGMALAAAYDVLGFASLLQPQLRAQMEAAMGDIARGSATRFDVVKAAVGFYSEIFERVSGRSDAFLRLVKHYYHGGSDRVDRPRLVAGGEEEEETAPAQSIPFIVEERLVVEQRFGACGQCGQAMRLVEPTKDDALGRRFVQCQRCRGQYHVPGAKYVHLTVLISPPTSCPVCGFTVLQAENRQRQSKYTLCPYCYNHPPPPPLCGDMENGGGGGTMDFRCLQCLHPTCALAKGKEQIGVAKCIDCGQHNLRLRRSNNGGYTLSCAGYPGCKLRIGLPRAASIDIMLPQRLCTHCGSVLLLFDFRGVQPPPGVEEREILCVKCDIRLKEYLVILQRGRDGDTSVVGGMESGTVAGYPSPSNHSNSSASSSAQPYTLPSIRTVTTGLPSSGSGPQRSGGGGNPNGVMCHCGVPVKQLVSKKQNSYGKGFRTCANRQCNFFEWCE